MLSRLKRLRRLVSRRIASSGTELDASFYRLAYPDLAGLSDDQLTTHWVTAGHDERRIPSPSALAERFREIGLSPDDFDPVLYMKVYPDVVAAGMKDPVSAAVHFIHSGHAEKRLFRSSLPDDGQTRPDDHLFAFERSIITLRQWNALRHAAENDSTLAVRRRFFSEGSGAPSPESRPSSASTRPDASILVSLYRTDQYLDAFLGNMEEQTAFDRCEFAMVLVDPSRLERELCEMFASRHSNVHLSTHSERIGIYEAWNLGIGATTARYITNANADDLWSPRSLELQIEFLDSHPEVDVAYHDMYLSPAHEPSWDVVERIGFRTNFGDVTPRSLLHEFNTPANAPMWRRELHERIGLFDASYRSAGDWEFWIRCALGSARFAKMDTVHFCYFINDGGMSRDPSGPAALETRRVMDTYAHLV